MSRWSVALLAVLLSGCCARERKAKINWTGMHPCVGINEGRFLGEMGWVESLELGIREDGAWITRPWGGKR